MEGPALRHNAPSLHSTLAHLALKQRPFDFANQPTSCGTHDAPPPTPYPIRDERCIPIRLAKPPASDAAPNPMEPELVRHIRHIAPGGRRFAVMDLCSAVGGLPPERACMGAAGSHVWPCTNPPSHVAPGMESASVAIAKTGAQNHRICMAQMEGEGAAKMGAFDERAKTLDLREKLATFAPLEVRGCGEIGRHARLRIWCFGVGVRVPPPAPLQEKRQVNPCP